MMLNKWDYNDTLINEKIKDEIIIAGFYRFVKNFFQKHKKYNSSPGLNISHIARSIREETIIVG